MPKSMTFPSPRGLLEVAQALIGRQQIVLARSTTTGLTVKRAQEAIERGPHDRGIQPYSIDPSQADPERSHRAQRAEDYEPEAREAIREAHGSRCGRLRSHGAAEVLP